MVFFLFLFVDSGMIFVFPVKDLPTVTGRVVVIGSGLAGLSSAFSALKAGAQWVTIVEKNKFIGGNSAKATSGMNAVNFRDEDSPTTFEIDTLKAGHERNDLYLVQRLAYESEGEASGLLSLV